MATCPNCGNNIQKPLKVLKNQVFIIEGYSCNKCKNRFKVAIDSQIQMPKIEL